MKMATLILTLAMLLPFSSPASATPAEVMPIVEEVHESILRKVFVVTSDVLKALHKNEAKEKERQQWQQNNAYGIGIRG